MENETATNPSGGEDTDFSTLAGDAGVETETLEPTLDDYGNPVEPDDSEEVEQDGQKFRVPKALKDSFLRQADYTRKTQEVADMRRAVEAERQVLHQASDAEIGTLAQVRALDQQLGYYNRIDWDRWEQQDPFEAQKGWRQFQQLQQARQQTAGHFSQLVQHRNFVAQQDTARRIEEGRAVLARDIKGWGPELASGLLETGARQYGLHRAEIEEAFTDPRLVKVLHDAHQYRLIHGKQQQAQRHLAAQQAEPAARPAASRAPGQGLDDRLSAEEWARRRDEQVRKRRAR
ncbi:MAG TPA: hypothetical protein VGF77_05645 [Allosphingosinicella sp.]|jgi:hypothetical protein